jgi:hypothetical protein
MEFAASSMLSSVTSTSETERIGRRSVEELDGSDKRRSRAVGGRGSIKRREKRS